MNSELIIVGLVPMRHRSERVPGKNLRPLAGKPLFHHIVESLLASPRINRVVIDTDSDQIAADALQSFERIEIIRRPDSLLGSDVSMNKVLLHDVEIVDADLYVQTHSTNPLLRTATIEAAVDEYLTHANKYDSLFTVTRIQSRFWDSDKQPINHDPHILLRTQELTPVFQENSNLYIFTRASLERHGNRIGEKPLMFEIPQDEAWDIDEEIDFKIAACLQAERQEH